MPIIGLVNIGLNKYGTVQELRSTFSHIKSINIDFSLVWFVSLYVDLNSVCLKSLTARD